MEKSEIMKRYEAETGCSPTKVVADQYQSTVHTNDYVAWLEAKAAAYDKVMSHGLSMKELANVLKHPVAIENDDNQNALYYFNPTPHIGQYSDGTQFWSCKGKWRLPRQLVHLTGLWQDSLTLPDGWEEK